MSNGAESFRKVISDWVKARHGSIEWLSEKAGVSRTTIQSWRDGSSTPTLTSLDAVAAALGVEPWELIKPRGAGDTLRVDIADVLTALSALGSDRLLAISRLNEAQRNSLALVLDHIGDELPPGKTDDGEDKSNRRKHGR